MIKLNLPVLFAEKGIRVADADRMSKLGRSTLYRMYNNEVTRIDFETLNELCNLLECKPGDIILCEEDDPSEDDYIMTIKNQFDKIFSQKSGSLEQ